MFFLERISVFCQPMPYPSCSGVEAFVYLHTLIGSDRVHHLACLKGPFPEDSWGIITLSDVSLLRSPELKIVLRCAQATRPSSAPAPHRYKKALGRGPPQALGCKVVESATPTPSIPQCRKGSSAAEDPGKGPSAAALPRGCRQRQLRPPPARSRPMRMTGKYLTSREFVPGATVCS